MALTRTDDNDRRSYSWSEGHDSEEDSESHSIEENSITVFGQ